MKRNLLIISFIIAGLLFYLLGYLRNQSFVINYQDTYYVIDNSSFSYFIFYLYSIPVLFYLLFRKHFNFNVALLHLFLKSVSLFFYLYVDYLQQNSLPRRYFLENHWYENEYINTIILCCFSLGIVLFLLNVILSLVNQIKSIKRASS
jgi:heme/copper-type cytochrome/quinol oxidase subunit 1